MKRSLLVGLAFAALVVSITFGAADAQISFSEGYVTFSGGDVLLTVPEIQNGPLQGWVTWKLNFGTLGWDLLEFGLTADVPQLGPRTATGRFIHFPQRAFVVMDIESSNFLGCGLELGTEVLDIQSLTATELTFTIIEPDAQLDNIQISCQRQGGTPGDIVGVWSCDLGPQGSMSVDLRANGTVFVTGNMLSCLLD